MFSTGTPPGRRGRDERGQAAVELLLVLPVFFMFVLLVVEFGLVMYQYVSVANGVREGARFAAVGCNSPATDGCTLNGGACSDPVKTRTVDRSSGFLDCADVTVSWGGTGRGEPVVVSAERSHELLFFPFISFPISSCSTMRTEQSRTAPAGTATGCP